MPFTPARLVLASMVGLWVCYFLLTTLRGYIVGLEFQDELLWRRLLVTFAGVGVTLAMWPILRLFEHRATWIRIAAALLVALPASLVLAITNEWVFSSVQEKVVAKIGEREGISIRRDEAGNLLVDVPNLPSKVAPAPTVSGAPPAPDAPPPGAVTIGQDSNTITRWRQLTDLAVSRYFLLLAWAALYMALGYAQHARVAERREAEHRRVAKAAELRSLRYQVNPHFLFNTLNSLSALVLAKRTDQAETMIQTIATFYRRSLAGDPTADVPLEEEVRLQRLYLEIEAVRFPSRLRTRFDIADDVANACVPGMILQPLIENSVKHGIAPVTRPVTIAITAHREDDSLVIAVSDDGAGGQDQGEPREGWGIGLVNVADRLRARFGAAASVSAAPVAQGFATVIRLPLVRHDC